MREREETQIQPEQQSSLLRSSPDVSPDLAFYRNEDKEFSGCNRTMKLLTGKNEKQLIHLRPQDVYNEEAAGRALETDEKVSHRNVSLTHEQWLDYPDGRKACFEICKIPCYDRVGECRGLMGLGRDVTERKRYQDALERASRDKITFISTVGHELRAPLDGVAGLSRTLLDTELTSEQEKHLETIRVLAVTLGNIFNDIIGMDKMERRKIQLDNQPVDFVNFLADLENLSGPQTQQKDLRFVLEPSPPLPRKVIADGTHLRQIPWNPTSNAVKLTPQGGGVNVRVRYDEGDILHFEVEDSGIGTPEAEQDKIFTMYYQVKDSHGGKSATGTGTGLTISRRLARNMGGDISVTNQSGKGATFTLTVHAPATVEEMGDTLTEDDMPLSAFNVLLVEGIEFNVIAAHLVLEKLGSSMDIATTGKAVLEMFEPGEHDLVLPDIQLPDMTGLDIPHQPKQNFAADELLSLVTPAINVLRNKKEYLDVRMGDVLSRPSSVPTLTAMIKRFWDTPEEETQEAPAADLRKADAVLNTDILEQYIELVGPKFINGSPTAFEKMMPGYMSILEFSLTTHDQKGIVEEGHKIKGVAGSTDPYHIQQLEQQTQVPNLPAWSDNIAEWIEEMKSKRQNDTMVLKTWVAKAGRK